MPKLALTRRQLLIASGPNRRVNPTVQAGTGQRVSPGADATRQGSRPARSHPRRAYRRRGPGSGRTERHRRPTLPTAGHAVRAGPAQGVQPQRGRCRPGGRPRRLLPGVDLQRHGPRPGHPDDRGRPPSRQLRQRGQPPAHDPLPRHPPGEHGRCLRGRRPGVSRSCTNFRRALGLHLYHCHSTPLKETCRQGPVRRVHRRPARSLARRRRSSSWS